MTEYLTKAGDTFDGIAYKELGDEFLSSEIIKCNPQYSDVVIFGENKRIILPEITQKKTVLAPWEV